MRSAGPQNSPAASADLHIEAIAKVSIKAVLPVDIADTERTDRHLPSVFKT